MVERLSIVGNEDAMAIYMYVQQNKRVMYYFLGTDCIS